MNVRTGLAGLLLIIAFSAAAHPLAPMLLELRQSDAQDWEVLWRYSTLRTSSLELQPVFPAHCQPKSERDRDFTEAGRVTESWRIACEAPGLAGELIQITGLAGSPLNVILHIRDLHGNQRQYLLDSATPEIQLPNDFTDGAAFLQFLSLGAIHLAGGADHLLFLLGLLLLAKGWRQLLFVITAFTLGHSLTLALATLDILSIATPLAELLIALTLVVTARELLHQSPTFFSRHLTLVALLFGLIHGLGFADSLLDIGLPREALLGALAGFNLGIEITQIGLAAAWLLVLRLLPLLSRPTLRPLFAYLIGTVAVVWCLERLILMQDAASLAGL